MPHRLSGPRRRGISLPGSSSIVVAVVDSGVELTHPDLAGKVDNGKDFANDDPDASDVHGHGTHVAGIVAAGTNNSQGVAGIGYDSRVLAVKVLKDDNTGLYSHIIAGIVYAADQGAQIINLSLGGTAPSQAMEDAVNYAWGKGALVVAAAGNFTEPTVAYPAAYDNVIAVAATNSTDGLYAQSNSGAMIDVAAPGQQIYSTYLTEKVASGYASSSGTSMAAPHVSGVAALMLACSDWLTNAQVREMIESTAVDKGDPGWDEFYGHGRIDAHAAVEAACSAPPPTAEKCEPSCTEIDGKSLFVVSGAGFQTLAQEPVAFLMSSTADQLNFGLFDADIGGSWDSGDPAKYGVVRYTIYADPDRTGERTGLTEVSSVLSSDAGAVDNDWYDITLAQHEDAFDGSAYHYLVVAEYVDSDAFSGNSFKARVEGDILFTDYIVVGFLGAVTGAADIVFPNGTEDSSTTTYDGEWTFTFDVQADVSGEVPEVTIWDGDMDHGDGENSNDIDDPDTPNSIPEWVTSPDVLPEGAKGIGAPKDNNPSSKRPLCPWFGRYLYSGGTGRRHVLERKPVRQP